ncbi:MULTISPECIES: hypothetical protein [unclassified Anabaena]|uniref:hypothetical protein n=1 Tax=unclassified Anabaena TaxID=2619674 RepID=UPI0014478554|nr:MULTISPECIES: hypothetical protein [unclassified Anabaena]MTJ08242.1 hypothetical protein [Anabaena sp. UHCC 0204]MTJ53471.1 hypothetical protein [Anabaena sp. UHCC 0253]
MIKKRILICTFLALSSGFFGSLIAGQITVILHSQKCQNQAWGLKEMCSFLVTPGASWQGSTTGLWTGTILGAFVGGLITRKSSHW